MKNIIIAVVFLLVLVSCARQIEKEEDAIKPPEEQKTTEPEQKGTQVAESEVMDKVEIKAEEPVIENTVKRKELSISSSIISNRFGFLTGAPEEAETAKMAGAGWVRPHPGPFVWGFIEKSKGSFDFDDPDKWVEEAQTNNLGMLATVWPYADWEQGECRSKECEVSTQDTFYPRSKMESTDGLPLLRCAPCNMNDYKSFLSRLVERYDGDGIDDMPSLDIPVKHYEILNEPEMKEYFLTFYKGTKEEYVEILKESYETIKSACPDCVVVQGGAAGISSGSLDYWKDIFKLGGDNYFDIANIHYVNFGDLSSLNVNDFKKLMQDNNVNKPLWVTEAEYSSESQVEHSAKGAFESGASMIFFTRFEVGKQGPPVHGVYSKVYDQVIT